MARLVCHIYGIPETDSGHIHDYAHILLPLTESMAVRLDGAEHLITAKHIGFVAPNKYHHCMSIKKVLQINIPASMIKEWDVEILENHVSLPVTGVLKPLVELIKSEIEVNPDSDSLRYLYYYLYDKMVERGGIKSIRYIREHFGEDISITTLAALENYNVTYFTDWFKRKTGVSPSLYIRQLRIEKAKELLISTRYRMIDIAVQVGYTGNASFSRAFKDEVGISPAEYRKRYAYHPQRT